LRRRDRVAAAKPEHAPVPYGAHAIQLFADPVVRYVDAVAIPLGQQQGAGGASVAADGTGQASSSAKAQASPRQSSIHVASIPIHEALDTIDHLRLRREARDAIELGGIGIRRRHVAILQRQEVLLRGLAQACSSASI
jgi:hypothetical protein